MPTVLPVPKGSVGILFKMPLPAGIKLTGSKVTVTVFRPRPRPTASSPRMSRLWSTVTATYSSGRQPASWTASACTGYSA